jgi:hypothetical protein
MVYYLARDMQEPNNVSFKQDFITRFRFSENTFVRHWSKSYGIDFTQSEKPHAICHFIYFDFFGAKKQVEMTREILSEQGYDFKLDSYNLTNYTNNFPFMKESFEFHKEIIEPIFYLFETFSNIYELQEFIEVYESLDKDFVQFHQKILKSVPFSKKQTSEMLKKLKDYNKSFTAHDCLDKLDKLLLQNQPQ